MQIGTHNGIFQADDVLAVAMLLAIHPDAKIVRTRDPKVLRDCDIVVDVGGTYDHGNRRYDHHQVGRAGARENGVLYSACGLVWKHYGHQVCEKAASSDAGRVADLVDQRFVQTVDAIDNGQDLYTGGTANFAGARILSFSSLISSINPAWHEKNKDFDFAFRVAVDTADLFLARAVKAAQGEDLARQMVIDAVILAGAGAAVVPLDTFCPWQETIHVEAPGALYVTFRDETGKHMVQCVPDKPGSFQQRKPLPEAWAGLRDEELQKLTGVEDAIFCHPGRFICGAASYEGAARLANLALYA